MKKNRLTKIILTALLIAINIILERVPALKSVSSHISLSVITLGFSAVYLGVPYTVAIAALGDLLGALILPFGAYNPLFTLTNAVSGFIIGAALSKNVTPITVAVGVVANKIICTLLLNSLWVAIFYSGGIFAFPAVAIGRIPQAVIMCVTEILLLLILFWDKARVRKLLDKAVSL